MGSAKILWVIVVALFSFSCRPPPVTLKDVSKEYSSKDYERHFEMWTRHGEVYNFDTLENSLKVSATYLSWEMRQVYVARYAYDYGLDEKRRGEMLRKERETLDSGNVFLVAATATQRKWAQFHKEDNPWRITLITSQGIEVLPSRVERIRSPSPLIVTYFPFVTIYREVYRFWFPLVEEKSVEPVLTPDLNSFSLVFAGALGRVELKWKVKH